MKNILKIPSEFIEYLVVSSFPIRLAPLWFQVVRGIYTSELVKMYIKAAYWLELNKIEGDIFEFGVGSGASSCLIYNYTKRISPKIQRELFLFDSFQGLPECAASDYHPQWEQGTWAFTEKFVLKRLIRYGVDLEKVHVVSGYYKDSLKPDLKKKFNFKGVALLHIDCDLYSSTHEALNFLTPYVQDGTIILLDDYFCYSGNPNKGEAGAFQEWCKNNNIVASSWFPYGFHGNSFILTVSHNLS